MSASQNNLTLTVNQQDANGVNIINRLIGQIAFAGVAGEMETRQAPDTSQHTFDLPTPTILQIVIHNTHGTGVLTITGTINGGASQTVCKVGPGGVFASWEAVAGAGWTDLKYTASVGGTTFEYFFGG